MNNSISFTLPNSVYIAKKLEPRDEKILQYLYEQCSDYAILTDGYPPPPSAAATEFLALPEGKTTDDKFIFGLFAPDDTLVGMLETIRHYPAQPSWWVGLMMLAPEHRRQGLGTKFYQAYESWIAKQGTQLVFLAVLVENQPGLNFWEKLGFKLLRLTPPEQFGSKVHRRYVLQKAVENCYITIADFQSQE